MDKQLFVTALTEVSSTDKDGVGNLRWGGNQKMYRYVKNPITNVSFKAGDVVCHSLADGASSLNNIYTPSTANLSYLAGVVQGPIQSNTGTLPLVYGWIQTLGISDQAIVLTPQATNTATAGQYFVAVNGVNQVGALAVTPTYSRYIQNLSAAVTTTGSTTSIAAGLTFINTLG